METTRLRLRVVAGATRHPGVVGRYGDAWKIRVVAPPVRGAANEAVIQLLARTLGVPSRAVRLVSGYGSHDKIVEVAGIEPAEIESRLASAERKDA